MIKQTVVVLLLMTGTAAAKCGPSLDITFDVEDNSSEYSNRVTGNELYEGRYGPSVRSTYGPTEDEDEDLNLRLTFKIPLGEDYCTEQESAQLRRDEGYADRAELDNIEKTLRLCKQYGDNHPLLEGKCN